MKKYLILIIITVLVGLMIQVAYGETYTIEVKVKEPSINGTQSIPYFIDSNFFMDRNQPVVCLHESRDSGYNKELLETMTKNALNNWTDKLKEKTNNITGWYLHYTFVPEDKNKKYTDDYKFCDINIFFTNNTPLNMSDGGYVKGGTWHYTRINHWADIAVYTWEYYPINGVWDSDKNTWLPQFEAKLADHRVSQQVLEHELGHAFGLKHHEIDGELYVNGGNYDKEHAELSILYYATNPNYDENHQIRDIDIDAIINKYGEDGWGGKLSDDWLYIK